MLVAFELSMPSKASWNGKWSGENRPYVVVKNFCKANAEETKILEKLDTGEFHYRWEDGWCACVSLRKVDAKEAAKLRKASVGFFGYNWMIESILKHGKICIEKEQVASN